MISKQSSNSKPSQKSVYQVQVYEEKKGEVKEEGRKGSGIHKKVA